MFCHSGGSIVTDDDLQTLGKAIDVKWDRLARKLHGITEDDIEEIVDRYKTLSQGGISHAETVENKLQGSCRP